MVVCKVLNLNLIYKVKNMQGCCLEGCESYKYITKQKIGYFKFPTQNKPLLKKWLNQIRIPNWLPTEAHQICSTHFHIDDLDFSLKQPKLKDSAIPMIFPLKHFKNIYIDKIKSDTIQEMTTKMVLNRIEPTQQIIMNNPNNILHTPTKSSSMVLLCTPTQESSNISNLQISSLPTSNISMKKIPIKNDLTKYNSKSPKLSALNPYVLIISDNKETRMPFENESLKKKHAILKIQIDKKINSISSKDLILDSLIKESECNQINKGDTSFKKSSMEEVEVDDISSSKIVVFKFNSSTGEIKVLKKEKMEKNIEVSRDKLDTKKSTIVSDLQSFNNNLEKNYLEIQSNSNQLVKDQDRLTNVKENIETFNSTKIVVSNAQSKINNLNIDVKSIKNISKDFQHFNKEDLNSQKVESVKSQLHSSVKKTTELSKNKQYFDHDTLIIKHNIQKRKLDAISTMNSKTDEYREMLKNTKKGKKDIKKSNTKIQMN